MIGVGVVFVAARSEPSFSLSGIRAAMPGFGVELGTWVRPPEWSGWRDRRKCPHASPAALLPLGTVLRAVHRCGGAGEVPGILRRVSGILFQDLHRAHLEEGVVR